MSQCINMAQNIFAPTLFREWYLHSDRIKKGVCDPAFENDFQPVFSLGSIFDMALICNSFTKLKP